MRGTEAKDFNFIRHFLKEKVLSPNMSKKLSRLEGRKLQDSSCDSIEVSYGQ